ncbi:hypothetical protein MACK_000803 [Theileria orientalis]|uniref:Adaptor protein ClpS core domain-containing protein n=1 Tax=Theileria orientalis TaxID=68886 RepID=A0A976QUM9_THEOR|nr:hypothetical protein MACK_000803 [Theileria orientalis]
MPRPSRKVQREASLTKKKVHERIRQTLKSRKTKTKAQEKQEREKEVESWRVILYNDDIHSFAYVTESLANCVPQLTIAKAHLLTLQAHRTGQAEILRTWKDKAEQYCRGEISFLVFS